MYAAAVTSGGISTGGFGRSSGTRAVTRVVARNLERTSWGVRALLGLLGWFLLCGILGGAMFAGIDEPYWGWSGVQRGMMIGVQVGGVVGGVYAVAAAGVPLVVCAVHGARRKRRGVPVAKWHALRGWLAGPWLCLPIVIVLGPWLMLSNVRWETMTDPDDLPDAIPKWVDAIALHAFPTLLLIVVLIVLCLATCFVCAALAAMRASVPAGRCERCDYEIGGLGLNATCPECGWHGEHARGLSARRSRLVQHCESKPVVICVAISVLVLCAAALIRVASYVPIREWNILSTTAVYVGVCITLPLLIAQSVRVRQPATRRAFGHAATGLLAVAAVVVLYTIAIHIAYQIDSTRHPNQEASWYVWASVRNAGLLLVPACTACFTATWLLISARMERRPA